MQGAVLYLMKALHHHTAPTVRHQKYVFTRVEYSRVVQEVKLGMFCVFLSLQRLVQLRRNYCLCILCPRQFFGGISLKSAIIPHSYIGL